LFSYPNSKIYILRRRFPISFFLATRATFARFVSTHAVFLIRMMPKKVKLGLHGRKGVLFDVDGTLVDSWR
jgi:hypothetical protein